MTESKLCEVAIAQIEERKWPLPRETKEFLLSFSRMFAYGGPTGMCASYAWNMLKEKHPRWFIIIQATYRKGAQLSPKEFDELLSIPWNSVLQRILLPEVLAERYPHLAPTKSQ